jgi:hypothetical protein
VGAAASAVGARSSSGGKTAVDVVSTFNPSQRSAPAAKSKQETAHDGASIAGLIAEKIDWGLP